MIYSNPYRWVVLGVFLLVAGLSQLLWLNFAPILSLVESRYQVTESVASLLLLVFPLVYVLLSIPAGNLIDRRGYRFTVGLGSVVMAFFSCVRIYDRGFWVLLVAQIGISVGQPFVVNGISKLVSDWFSSEQSALATGLGTMGMFIGMAAGMSVTPLMVDSWGFQAMLGVFAVVSCVFCAAFLFLARENPQGAGKRASESVSIGGFSSLLRNRDLLLLFALAFLGLGFFNGLTTWLEPILAPNGFNSIQAGTVGGVLIFGGIVGAVVIPALSDHFKRRKPFVIGSTVAALVMLYPLCHVTTYWLVLTFSALQGFFFLPAFALLLEICSELAGKARAGAATGILMLAGNAGGVVVILAMDWVRGGAPDFSASVVLMEAILAAAVLIAWFLPKV